MESIEVTGENVEAAIQSGLSQLGVGPGDVIVEVLEEGGRGVFGLGAREARVRLQVLFKRAADSDVDAESEPAGVTPSEQPEAVEMSLDAIEDDDATVGRDVLAELLDKMGVEARISVRRAEATDDDERAPWMLDVSGRDMNALIGRRGETLSSLQYVTRLIASRKLQRRANIVVDVENYKSRRSDRLHQLALRMANQAMEQGRTISLEPMPPHERRIIHLALRDHSGVSTESEGEGSERKVTIIPQ